MKTLTKIALAAAALSASPLALSVNAQAQVATAADPRQILMASNAMKTARTQIQTTYKAQIDAADSRAKILQADLNALLARYEADAKANPNNPALQTQGKTIQDKEAAAQQEIARLSEGFSRAQEFALEQVDTKLDQAFTNAMNKKRIQLVIPRGYVMKVLPAADLTTDILAELNALVPTVSINVPAGWQPGGQRPAAAGAAPAAPRPATPQGR
jgi:Skp family chaperone for outer membrane proteins